MSALNAKLVIFSGKKSRTVPIRDFFVLPDINVERENILQPGEIITEIQIPDFPGESGSGYIKLKERGAWDFAVVSVAIVVQKNGSSFMSGKIAIDGVAPIPWLEKEVST